MMRPRPLLSASSLAIAILTSACAHNPRGGPAEAVPPKPVYAIAIHGGTGVLPRNASEEERLDHETALAAALSTGLAILEAGGTALDAVEAAVVHLEEDSRFNAGRGAVFTERGNIELDASIMDGSNLMTGAVASVTTVRNPVRVARLVMEKTPHVLLVGPGADEFAVANGAEIVEQDFFHVERQWQRHRQGLERQQSALPTDPAGQYGTVGAVALDRAGNLAAATSTGGRTNKMHGRVGDSPIAGAGNYANNRTLAISCTGNGELFIRHTVAHRISSRMEYLGESLQAAMDHVFGEILPAGSGGGVAVDRDGNVVMRFNSRGMFRGAADSLGRFEVAIWGDEL